MFILILHDTILMPFCTLSPVYISSNHRKSFLIQAMVMNLFDFLSLEFCEKLFAHPLSVPFIARNTSIHTTPFRVRGLEN